MDAYNNRVFDGEIRTREMVCEKYRTIYTMALDLEKETMEVLGDNHPITEEISLVCTHMMNGDIGITLPVPDETQPGKRVLKVVFPSTTPGKLNYVLPSRLGEIETVYAMTVHKSQGSEFTHTALVLPTRDNPILTRELVYTGITRARKLVVLVGTFKAVAIATKRYFTRT